MASISLVKKIVEGFASGNNDSVIEVLEQESKKLQKLGRNKASKEILALIKDIPVLNNSDKKVFKPSSATSYTHQKSISSLSQGNKNLVTVVDSQIVPENVVLNSDSKHLVSNLFREWENAETLRKSNLQPTNKVLLYGAPGTGKTYLANAIASQMDLPLTIVKLDELVSSYLGSTGKNIREIFEIAESKPTVLFLDEFDTVAKFRSDEKELGELKRIVTVLLQNIDLFPSHSILIAATNHEDILDKAVWRRFPLKLKMDLPDKESVKRLLKIYLTDIVETNINEEVVSEMLNGISGSDIRNISEHAIRKVVIDEKPRVTTEDLIESYFTLGGHGADVLDKKSIYSLCKKLKRSGLNHKRISKLTGIPYSTVRDNV